MKIRAVSQFDFAPELKKDFAGYSPLGAVERFDYHRGIRTNAEPKLDEQRLGY